MKLAPDLIKHYKGSVGTAPYATDTTSLTELELRERYVQSLIKENQLTGDAEALFRSLEPHLKLKTLVNAVSPVFTGRKLDLSLVEPRAKELNLKYSKSTGFVGISVKLSDPQFKCKYTAIFFSSGSVNCVGLGSDAAEYLHECSMLLKKYCRIFFGDEVAEGIQLVRKITNRVYTIRLEDYRFELQEMKKLDSWRSSKYVSDAFPGLIKAFDSNPATKKTRLLLFKTGKLIFTGIKNHLTKFEVEKQLLAYFAEIVKYKMLNPESRIIYKK